MDNQKQSHRVKKNILPPSYLWIGPHKTLVEQTISFLQEILCPNNNCHVCITCVQIRNQQHHSIIWLYPEKQYTLAHLEVINHAISFQLDKGKHCFFIIQKSDFLTRACSNSLLKSIEEPPPGFHFILHAQHQDRILPTIASRCIAKSFYSQEKDIPHQELFNYFTSTKPVANPSIFLSLLAKSNINERESIELLDALLNYWIKQFKKTIQEKNIERQQLVTRIINVLKKAMRKPPMPGSSKIFWKNLLLQLQS